MRELPQEPPAAPAHDLDLIAAAGVDLDAAMTKITLAGLMTPKLAMYINFAIIEVDCIHAEAQHANIMGRD